MYSLSFELSGINYEINYVKNSKFNNPVGTNEMLIK